jgi:hypothetical protein
MEIINFIKKYLWLIGIMFTFLNIVIISFRLKKSKLTEEDKTDARKTLKIYSVCLGIPWIVMGISSYFGKIDNFIIFFKAIPFDIWVWLFYFSLLIVWSVGFYWIFFKDGANKLIKYKGILWRNTFKSVLVTKLAYIGMIIGAILAIIILTVIDFKI